MTVWSFALFQHNSDHRAPNQRASDPGPIRRFHARLLAGSGCLDHQWAILAIATSFSISISLLVAVTSSYRRTLVRRTLTVAEAEGAVEVREISEAGRVGDRADHRS